MPRSPGYPHDHSTRYPASVRDQIQTIRVAPSVQGVIQTPEGDLRTWVIDADVREVHRDLLTALAYLDVADQAAGDQKPVDEQRHRLLVAQIDGIKQQLVHLQAAVDTNARTLQTLVAFLGVVVPPWRTLEEVERGDDMGMNVDSAQALGLLCEIVSVQRQPGFDHEQVIDIEPPAGTLVAKGTKVRVRVNYQG